MNLLQEVRTQIIFFLLKKYIRNTPDILPLQKALEKKNTSIVYDHFAIIDIPGPNSGINNLRRLFEMIGFQARGKGYLPEKQNDFLWLSEENPNYREAKTVLPQIVIADFRLEKCTPEVKEIVEKYANQTAVCPFQEIEHLSKLSSQGDEKSADKLVNLLCKYFSDKSRPLPTLKDFKVVHNENQLLAWSLVFEKEVNHFAIAAHLLDQFDSFEKFNEYLEQLGFVLNNVKGQKIKGTEEQGIRQSSNISQPTEIILSDGNITVLNRFIEFVWRYPVKKDSSPHLWGDFFVDFVAQNANTVIESLYEDKTNANL